MTASTTRPFQVQEILCSVRIAAPPARVWRALVDETASWWHRDFYTGRDPRGFHIEARPGGRMWEDWGDGQGLVWGTVLGVRKNEMLQVAGLLDAQFGGPAGLISTIRLEAESGGTVVRFHEATCGAAGDATRKSLDVGWQFLLERCLKVWIESGKRCTDPAPAG